VSALPRSSILAAVAFLLVSAVFLALWAWLGRPVALPEVAAGRLDCVSYTPYDGGSTPLDPEYTVPLTRIEADMDAISRMTSCIRTYASAGIQGEVVPIAERHGIVVLQGIWISGNAEMDAKEIAAGLAVARAYPLTVKALVVGNEVLLRRELPGQELAALIARVRAASPVPVTYADIFEFWRRNPVVAEAVDFMSVHVLPYWDDPTPVGIDEVQAHSRRIIERVGETFPDKRFIVGEIGWPSAGRTRGRAEPSRVNQARFVREFAAVAAEIGVDYNLIEGLDQPWKRAHEGTVGGFWGVLDKSRTPKFGLTGPVREWPAWPLAFALGAALAGGVAVWTLGGRRILGFGRWVMLAALGHALGLTLAFHWRQTAETAQSLIGWLVGGVGTAVMLVAAGILAALLSGDPARIADRRPATVAAVGRWLRRPTRDGLSLSLLLGGVQALAAIAAAYLCITYAFDPRHRDVPIAMFALPAVALLAHWLVPGWRPEPPNGADRREEGWLALVLLVAGAVSLEGFGNREAMAWFAVAAALALPWIGAMVAEASRLRRLLVEPRGA